jgi:adenylate kinase
MRAGRLVPDELVLGILRDRLARPDAARGFVLDGFPRTLAQADALDRLTPLEAVIAFDIDPRALVARLAGRRSCPSCGAVYNLSTNPPRRPGYCDREGAALLQRPDDLPEAVEVRLRVYDEQTAPLREHYRRRGLLRTLDASGAPPEVAARLRHLLDG